MLILSICIVGLPILFLIWLNRRFTTYRLTNQRIILEHGIIFKKIDEIELYRVKDVKVVFSLLNQMANIGTIALSSSDRTTAANGRPLVMEHIKDARKHRETMRSLIETIRQRRGVREVDMMGSVGEFSEATQY
jgi:uncharacterized membrane protein YdbT with pleckstrin-like domain